MDKLCSQVEDSAFPFHVKFGFTNKFVKTMDYNDQRLRFQKYKYPRVSDAEMKEGIFIDPVFEESLNAAEASARMFFKNVIDKTSLVIIELSTHRQLGCHMFLKNHFLTLASRFSSSILGAVGDEHGIFNYGNSLSR